MYMHKSGLKLSELEIRNMPSKRRLRYIELCEVANEADEKRAAPKTKSITDV
jgi:hypothetical protein